MPVFVLRMVYGENWDEATPRREQRLWHEHAAFMDRLVDDGFVVLGGPIGDGRDVQVIVKAEGEDQIRERLRADPWEEAKILRIGSLEPWTIWLDGVQNWSKPGG